MTADCTYADVLTPSDSKMAVDSFIEVDVLTIANRPACAKALQSDL